MARIFVSYKRNAPLDERLCDYFVKSLSEQGHRVFIDKQITLGQNWPEVIQTELEQADFVIVLLSEESVASEMLIEEVKISYERKKTAGTPIILPVRLNYIERLPYDLGAILDRSQCSLWIEEGDERNISQQLKIAISQGREFQEPLSISQVSEIATGDRTESLKTIKSPLPSFDSQWLERLDMPGGTVRLQSPFYIEREVDFRARAIILRKGVTLRIKGSRQMGKSSLLARLYQHAREHQSTALYIDFQLLDQEQFQNLDTLLFTLANLAATKLDIDKLLNRYWNVLGGSKDKITRFVMKEMLEHAENPIVLLLDEVDRLFTFESYRDDFFSLIRYWHNQRAIEPVWEKLNIVLGYSTEAFMFIKDLNLSPFNVGVDLTLDDFSVEQVEDLNSRHGGPIRNSQEMNQIMDLLQGHPFLTRKVLYDLVVNNLTVNWLASHAVHDDGPFNDHLHRYLWWFNKHPELGTAMKSAIKRHSCSSDEVFYMLRSAGLVRGSGRMDARPRCGLYAKYFEKYL